MRTRARPFLASILAAALALGLACKPRTKACPSGWDDCDKKPGCETHIDEDVNNCGLCGNDCSAAHGKPSCRGGKCGIACGDGWGNCDDSTYNGCETDLTTTKNCGKCGLDCGTGYCRNAACFKPTTVAEAVKVGQGIGLTFDGEHGFFAGKDAIYKAPMLGGEIVKVKDVRGVVAVAVDEAYLYWADGGAIYRQKHKGPPFVAQRIVTAPVVAMTIDERHVYWTEPTRVMRASLGGGRESEIAVRQADPRGIALTEDSVLWACFGTFKRGFADAAILRAPKGGGEATTVVMDASPRALATDGTSVYFSTQGEIKRALLAGSEEGRRPQTMLTSDEEIIAVGIGGASLFWLTKAAAPKREDPAPVLGTLAKIDK